MAGRYDDYLQVDEQENKDSGNLWAIPAAAGMYVAMFTPLPMKLGKDIFKTVKNVGMWTAESAMGTAGKVGAAGSRASKTWFQRTWANREKILPSIKKSAQRMGESSIRGAARGAEFITKNATGIGATVVGGSMLWGAARGILNPVSEGPEVKTEYDFSTGIPHDNLGATGDLTLALHHVRRR